MWPLNKSKKEKEQKRKRRNIIIFSLVGSTVVLGGAGTGLYFILNQKKNNDDRIDLAKIVWPGSSAAQPFFDMPIPINGNSWSDDEFEREFMRNAKTFFSDWTEVDLIVNSARTVDGGSDNFTGSCTITITAKQTAQKYKGEVTLQVWTTTAHS